MIQLGHPSVTPVLRRSGTQTKYKIPTPSCISARPHSFVLTPLAPTPLCLSARPRSSVAAHCPWPYHARSFAAVPCTTALHPILGRAARSSQTPVLLAPSLSVRCLSPIVVAHAADAAMAAGGACAVAPQVFHDRAKGPTSAGGVGGARAP